MTDAEGDKDRYDPGDHPVPIDEVTPEDRARALQSLLVEKELLSTDAVDEVVSAYEEEIGPMNGAAVVARAWTDPEYREWLLDDGTAAIAEMGYTGVQGTAIAVKENAPDVHNVVVCTLCSCYPWPVLGLPPTWYKSPPYRSKIVKQPRTTLREEFDVPLTDDVEVRVWDSSSEIRYLVLPQQPPETEGLDREELTSVVTRDAMIGVERLVGPPATDGGASPGLSRSASVEQTVDDIRAMTDLPTDDGVATFAAPWQARAFAIAVRLRHDGQFPWTAFQARLATVVATGSPDETAATGAEDAYYRQWLAALERLLLEESTLSRENLATRARAFASGDRDAAEFVHGNGSDHTHPHDHVHTHSHDDHAHSEASAPESDEPLVRDPVTE